jgi:hypothetical protein
MAESQPFDDNIILYVQPMGDGSYGVYADAVLIGAHINKVRADSHCQRLIQQQAQEKISLDGKSPAGNGHDRM